MFENRFKNKHTCLAGEEIIGTGFDIFVYLSRRIYLVFLSRLRRVNIISLA